MRYVCLGLMAVLLCAAPSYATYTFKVSATCGGLNTCTTSGVDTTGVDLIVVSESYDRATGAPTLSDSGSNTYTCFSAALGTAADQNLCYKQAPAGIGAGFTWTCARNGDACAINVLTFSGSVATPADQQNSAINTSATSLTSGAITPTVNNELLVTGISWEAVTTGPTVNSGFSSPVFIAFNGGVNYGDGISYLIQGAAATVTATWSWTNTSNCAAMTATFKDTAAAGGGGPPLITILGVGK